MSAPSDTAIRDHLAAAWPPAERERAGGWLLRATPAVPRGRLNSALPLAPDPDLAPVEAFYAARGLPPQVQVTPLDGHPALVAELDRRGWETRWPTAVLAGEAAAVGRAVGARHEAVELLDGPAERWLAAWGAAEGRAPEDVRAHADTVLAQLGGRAAYAVAAGGDAVGVAVAGEGLCGLFCVATRPERRRRGLAAAVVAALAGWAHERGAPWLCLEVEQRNAPALALYARLGFTRRYAYVHRLAVRPGGSR